MKKYILLLFVILSYACNQNIKRENKTNFCLNDILVGSWINRFSFENEKSPFYNSNIKEVYKSIGGLIIDSSSKSYNLKLVYGERFFTIALKYDSLQSTDSTLLLLQKNNNVYDRLIQLNSKDTSLVISGELINNHIDYKRDFHIFKKVSQNKLNFSELTDWTFRHFFSKSKYFLISNKKDKKEVTIELEASIILLSSKGKKTYLEFVEYIFDKSIRKKIKIRLVSFNDFDNTSISEPYIIELNNDSSINFYMCDKYFNIIRKEFSLIANEDK